MILAVVFNSLDRWTGFIRLAILGIFSKFEMWQNSWLIQVSLLKYLDTKVSSQSRRVLYLIQIHKTLYMSFVDSTKTLCLTDVVNL